MADTKTTPDHAPAAPVDTPEDYAHYAPKSLVVAAYITGDEIQALCGYRWVPSRDPDPLPVCPPCKAALARGGWRPERED